MYLEKTDIEFKDFDTWVNKAASWLGNREDKNRLVCIDSWSEKCTCGEDFHRAKKRKSFPVKVYKIVANDETNNVILSENDLEYLENIAEVIFGNELLPFKGASKFCDFVEGLRKQKENKQ